MPVRKRGGRPEISGLAEAGPFFADGGNIWAFRSTGYLSAKSADGTGAGFFPVTGSILGAVAAVTGPVSRTMAAMTVPAVPMPAFGDKRCIGRGIHQGHAASGPVLILIIKPVRAAP